MYDLLTRYRGAVNDLLRKAETTQRENIIKAGEAVSDCVAAGGAVFLSNIVHGIESDLLHRGGGPAFYRRFNYSLPVDAKAWKRGRPGSKNAPAWGLSRYVLEASDALPGDILFLSSVSGRTVNTVDLAWEAKNYGLKTILLTSVEYADSVDPVHPSGKKLHEFADIVLDNCAPAAEAMLAVDGLDAKFAAASGLSSAYIMWSLTAVAVESLIKRGVTPGVFKSANFPGGLEQSENVKKEYEERGY